MHLSAHSPSSPIDQEFLVITLGWTHQSVGGKSGLKCLEEGVLRKFLEYLPIPPDVGLLMLCLYKELKG